MCLSAKSSGNNVKTNAVEYLYNDSFLEMRMFHIGLAKDLNINKSLKSF